MMRKYLPPERSEQLKIPSEMSYGSRTVHHSQQASGEARAAPIVRANGTSCQAITHTSAQAAARSFGQQQDSGK